ncbi:MAG: glycoside hydrolase family 1 protein [Terracidiphilus sp.]
MSNFNFIDTKEAVNVSINKSGALPAGFLWGCATSAHQVEGNNTSSDIWMLEHLPKSIFMEPSGDACDHYHLYPQDIAMLASLGFNTYRFSLEWARIEPEEGFFSNAQLEHYRRMLAACREHNLTPMLTYSHLSLPRWFAMQGGWDQKAAADRFARFCERATRYLGDMVAYAVTLNEPNTPQMLKWLRLPASELPAWISLPMALRFARARIRSQVNAPNFSNLLLGDEKKTREGLLAAHAKGMEAIKAIRPNLPTGFSLAISDDQPADGNSRIAQKQAEVYGPWLEAARQCDFLGVQTYSRTIIGKKDQAPPKDVEVTQTGMEFYPECVGHVARYAARETGVPIIITESGIATDDDSRRVEYTRRALAGLKSAIDDGVDVRGYVAWSLMDNFEWHHGYKAKFGLIAVDFKTQQRTIKPSARMLGEIARRNAL